MKTTPVQVLLGILLFSGSAFAMPSAMERSTLGSAQPLLVAQNWYELSPQERSRALENYRRFQKLPPDKQRAIEDKYNRWMELPGEEQERIRRNYDRYRKMDSDQKEDFYRKYKQWRSLPR